MCSFYLVGDLKPNDPVVQVPCDLRAGGALHLPCHPQHPAFLRHETRGAAPPPADHQQDQQQRQEEQHGRQHSQEGHRGQVEDNVHIYMYNSRKKTTWILH